MMRAPLSLKIKIGVITCASLPVCFFSQVVVSGPAGFVFHVEGLLADLRIPPEVVVILD